MTHTLPNEEDMVVALRATTNPGESTRLHFCQPLAWIIYFGFSHQPPRHDPDTLHWDTAHYKPSLPCNCSFLAIF